MKLQVELIEYDVLNNGNYLVDHIFCFRVSIAQTMYKIKRSYADLCVLDVNLRRKYPRSQIIELPLTEKHQFSDNQTSIIFSLLRQNVTGSTSLHEGFSFVANKSELIPQKKNALNLYINSLLDIPEISRSEDLVWFLNEDYRDSLSDMTQTEVSEFDVLISSKKPAKKVVSRDFKISADVSTNSVVLWKFTTKEYDIGFSLSIDNKEVLTYQRYSSHIKPITGLLQMTQSGRLEMIWDNSYSKFRSKKLRYIVQVISGSQFDHARSRAAEETKARKAHFEQLSLLRSALVRHSAPKSTATTSLLSAFQPADSNYSENLIEECNRLREEKRSLQIALAEAEKSLIEERTAFTLSIENGTVWEDEVTDRRSLVYGNGDETSMPKQSHISQHTLNTVWEAASSGATDGASACLTPEHTTYNMLSDTAENHVPQLAEENMICTHMSENTSDSKCFENLKLQYESKLRELELSLQLQANKLVSEAERADELEKQVTILKVEKKQLKSYALQLKAEHQAVTENLAAVETQLKVASERLSKADTQLREAEFRISELLQQLSNQETAYQSVLRRNNVLVGPNDDDFRSKCTSQSEERNHLRKFFQVDTTDALPSASSPAPPTNVTPSVPMQQLHVQDMSAVANCSSGFNDECAAHLRKFSAHSQPEKTAQLQDTPKLGGGRDKLLRRNKNNLLSQLDLGF